MRSTMDPPVLGDDGYPEMPPPPPSYPPPPDYSDFGPYHDDPDMRNDTGSTVRVIEHSLPTADEARMDAGIGRLNSASGSRKRMLLYSSICCVALVVIIAFSVSLSGDKKTNYAAVEGETSNPNGQKQPYDSSTDAPRGEDVGSTEPSRLADVQDYLGKYVSNRVDLTKAGSSHYKAAVWIADVDNRFVDIPSTGIYDNAYEFIERYVLALFYYSMDGESWPMQHGFMSALSVCDWHSSITASKTPFGYNNVTYNLGVVCNEQKQVIQIYLPGNKLYGQLLPELSHLQRMEHLSLFNNNIYGPIPPIHTWTNLHFVAMETNLLSGEIPKWLAEAPVLEYLALGDNQFEGSLPNFSKAVALKEVALDYNFLTGPIDVFNQNYKLKVLYLNDNDFTGPVNDTLLDKVDVRILDISDNRITGTIPEDFYDIGILDMHNNSISGRLPPVSGSNSWSIEFLSVWGNKLYGTIPSSLSNLTRLYHLDLSNNILSGDMPNWNSFPAMEYLYVGYNNFDPSNFPVITKLTKLEELSMPSSNLMGTIPQIIGILSSLFLLDLSHNNLRGEIPLEMGNLSDLQVLILNNNFLTGKLPSTLKDCQGLTLIFSEKNRLNGTDNGLCGSDGPKNIDYFVTDCKYELDCECCTLCCSDDDPECNNRQVQTSLTDGYSRNQKLFSENIVFRKNVSI